MKPYCSHARSATAGSQRFPVHWGGDCSAAYGSMAESLRGGLSLSLSGFGFWSHDIGGFDKTATPDLYKRWVAFGMLSSHSRLHGNESYRVPWLFDEEAVDVLRFFTRLKCRLMPYLFGAAVEATRKGIPMMRAMVLEYPRDPTCGFLDRQYMLGGSILVAPIFNEEGIASYYLPNGTWTDFITGRKLEGGRWIEEKYGYMSIPMLVKQNSVIVTGNNDSRPDYDYADNIEFNLFELQEGCAASTEVFNTLGRQELTVEAVRSGKCVKFLVEGVKKPWKLVLWGIGKVSDISGGSVKIAEKGIMVIPHVGTSTVEIIL